MSTTKGKKKAKPRGPAVKFVAVKQGAPSLPRNRRPRQNLGIPSKLGQASGAYLRSILAPCSGNARIPDMNCLPTALVTLKQEILSSVTPAGIGGMITEIGTVPNYALENPSTTVDIAFTYLGTVNLTGVTAMQASYAYARPVSACVEVTFTGNSQTDSGVIIGWTLGSMAGGVEAGPTSVNGAFASRSNQSQKFRDGIGLFYRPADSTSFDFRSTASNYTFNRLGFHITGAAPSSPFVASITINYECVPSIDTFSPATTITDSVKPSPVDPAGHAVAVNYAAKTKPFTTFEQAQKATASMALTANDIASVISAAKAIFSWL